MPKGRKTAAPEVGNRGARSSKAEKRVTNSPSATTSPKGKSVAARSPVKPKAGASAGKVRPRHKQKSDSNVETHATVEVGGASKTAERARSGPTDILGQVMWLMMQSPAHKHLFFADAEWLVLPPVLAKQFRIFRRKGIPIAYASWAFLNGEVERRMLSGVTRIAPKDWRSGETPWLIDLITPFGGAEQVLEQLQRQVFDDQEVKTLRPAPDGSGLQVALLGQDISGAPRQKGEGG